MIESYSHAIFYCDGPNCDFEEEDIDYNSTTSPPGWLVVDGPSLQLGQFHFHSGLCYDNWRTNLNIYLTAKE